MKGIPLKKFSNPLNLRRLRCSHVNFSIINAKSFVWTAAWGKHRPNEAVWKEFGVIFRKRRVVRIQ